MHWETRGIYYEAILPDDAILLLGLPGDDLPDELVITEDFGESSFGGFLLQRGGN